MKRALLAFVVICLIPLFSAANAWEEHIDTVYEQLKSDHEYYEALGYTFMYYIVGKLDDDGVDSWTFDLSRGTDYAVSGACDDDCTDLDLRIKTASGAVVDRDVMLDAYPQVSVTPSWSRSYTIEVDMYTCRVEPCYYGIALFER